MRIHVDWLTFTIPMLYMSAGDDGYAQAIASGLQDMFGVELRQFVFGGTWRKEERSRAPYTDAWTQGEGIKLFASPNLTHACIEISGQGCENLLDPENSLGKVLLACKDRVTRIDVACDIETQISPMEFVGEVSHERMRTSGFVISDTGSTCYVGSQKSERYARVYRYNPPHPRSHLLRVEHVYRKDYARKVAQECAMSGIEAVGMASGIAFGWKHGVWQPTVIDSPDISVTRERGNSGNTVFWLINSVAPAFHRLCKSGAIQDPEAFLARYFSIDA
jgi:hypothetical protein